MCLSRCVLTPRRASSSTLAGSTEIPFEFPLKAKPGQTLYETYHGVFVNIQVSAAHSLAVALFPLTYHARPGLQGLIYTILYYSVSHDVAIDGSLWVAGSLGVLPQRLSSTLHHTAPHGSPCPFCTSLCANDLLYRRCVSFAVHAAV